MCVVFIILFAVVVLGGLGYKLYPACCRHDSGNAHGRGDNGYLLCLSREGSRVANGKALAAMHMFKMAPQETRL